MIQTRLTAVALLWLVLSGTAGAQSLPSPVSSVLQRLPQGLIRSTLGSLAPRQLALLERSSKSDAAEVDRLAASGQLDRAEANKELEKRVGLRAALLTASIDRQAAEQLRPELRAFGSADMLTAAYAPNVLGTKIASSLAPRGLKSFSESLLNDSQLIIKPSIPCDELTEALQLPGRSKACISRKGLAAVVGLGHRAGGQLTLDCSGVLLGPSTVATAEHCIRNGLDGLVVLLQFTGGGLTAVRPSAGQVITGLEEHKILAISPVARPSWTGEPPHQFDIAVLTITPPVTGIQYASRATQFPKPVIMTAAGWGKSNADPINGVAIEATVIQPSGGVKAEPPTWRSWPAQFTLGAGVCTGDSGGPIFAGGPDAKGRLKLALIGLVVGGNTDCVSGRQIITDLTLSEAGKYLCTQAPGTAFCK